MAGRDIVCVCGELIIINISDDRRFVYERHYTARSFVDFIDSRDPFAAA